MRELGIPPLVPPLLLELDAGVEAAGAGDGAAGCGAGGAASGVAVHVPAAVTVTVTVLALAAAGAGAGEEAAGADTGGGGAVPSWIAFCWALNVVEEAGHPWPGPWRFWRVTMQVSMRASWEAFELSVGKDTLTVGL